jgi:hypothetical protein
MVLQFLTPTHRKISKISIWSLIGVGTALAAPPSEPDWRISRIRLSG